MGQKEKKGKKKTESILESPSSTKWLYIIGAIVILAIVAIIIF